MPDALSGGGERRKRQTETIRREDGDGTGYRRASLPYDASDGDQRTGKDRRVASYRGLVGAFTAPIAFEGAPLTDRDRAAMDLVATLRRSLPHGDLIGREEVAQAIYAANGGRSRYDKSIHGGEFWLRAADAAIAAIRALPSPPQGVVVREDYEQMRSALQDLLGIFTDLPASRNYQAEVQNARKALYDSGTA